MNANSFSLRGYVAADAKVNNFEKNSVARFGLIIKTKDRKDATKVTTAIQSIETWVKNDDSDRLNLLKKGTFVNVSGFFKAEVFEKDGKQHSIVKLIATTVEKYQKENGDDKKED